MMKPSLSISIDAYHALLILAFRAQIYSLTRIKIKHSINIVLNTLSYFYANLLGRVLILKMVIKMR